MYFLISTKIILIYKKIIYKHFPLTSESGKSNLYSEKTFQKEGNTKEDRRTIDGGTGKVTLIFWFSILFEFISQLIKH